MAPAAPGSGRSARWILIAALLTLVLSSPGCATWITWEALPHRLDASQWPETTGVDRVQAWRHWRAWVVEVCEDGEARYELWRPLPERDGLERVGCVTGVPEGAAQVPVEVVARALDGRPSRFSVQDVEPPSLRPSTRRLTFDLERTEPGTPPLPRAVGKVLLRVALPLALALDLATFPFQLVALALADPTGLP